MPPPKRKDNPRTPIQGESSKRQNLSVPTPPSLINSAGASSANTEASTPTHTGTQVERGTMKDGKEYLWYEGYVLEDNYPNTPPKMLIVVTADEDNLPTPRKPRQVEVKTEIRDRKENWKKELVTLQYTRDTRDEVARNSQYVFSAIYKGAEGYGKFWGANLVTAAGYAPPLNPWPVPPGH